MDWVWFVLPIIGGFVLYAIISAGVKAPGHAQANEFAGLGNVKGRTKAEIIAQVGRPVSVSAGPDGGEIVQWMATGHHIVLIFDKDGICQGISHQHLA